MLDTTVLKNELQARINALTNASSIDSVLETAIAAKKVELIGVDITRTNLDAQIQRIVNALDPASAIEDLMVVAASLQKDDETIIGDIRPLLYQGDQFIDEKGRHWLIEGKLHTAEGYEEAFAIQSLKNYGKEVFFPESETLTKSPRQCARDGAGNIVIACNSSSYVLVSNNTGDSFELVEHSHGAPVVGVVHIGGHFILASNSATELKTSFSSDGGNSFGAATVARALTAATSNTVAGAATATTALFVVAGDTACVSMTNGSTKANRSLAVATTGTVDVLISAHAGTIVVASKGVAGYQKTVNGGAAFTTHNHGHGTPTKMYSHLNNFYWESGGGLYKSPDLSTWEFIRESVPLELTYNAINSYNRSVVSFPVKDGFLLASHTNTYFLYTQDFVTYERFHPSQSANELSYGTTTEFVVFGDLLMAKSAVDKASKILKFDVDAADYIGFGSLDFTFNRKPNYLRIK
ncbi:hypothetical protein [Cellvibrio sp. UBA7671]|uniref:hypothetical protein n=1 Tax=Cellvibrio sp. UBA7671 TaxID=1946312 RepID=UPI002F35C466